MARVPNWTELRLDAEKLVALQDEFDRRLNNLFQGLPELDKKIMSLDAERILDETLMWPIKDRTNNFTNNLTKPTSSSSSSSQSILSSSPLMQTPSPPHPRVKISRRKHSEPIVEEKNFMFRNSSSNGLKSNEEMKSNYSKQSISTIPKSLTSEKIFVRPKSPTVPESYNQPRTIVNTNEFDIHMHEPLKTAHPYYATVIDIPYLKKRDRSYPDDDLPAIKSPKQHNIIRSQTLNENLSTNCVNNNNNNNVTNGFKKRFSPPRKNKMKDIDLNKYEHLRPLDKPLSEYLRINRPKVVLAADRRVLYLKDRAEKRKSMASLRIINSLEQVRISSRSSTMSNRNRPFYQNNRNIREYASLEPNYHVEAKLTEYEMKRLTARIYNRLPEVKKKRKEEITNHMKVQNYKNKLEYGRKLLQNRRHGIINYPLRLNYDDRSVDTSQDGYSLTTNGNNHYLESADLSSSIDYINN